MSTSDSPAPSGSNRRLIEAAAAILEGAPGHKLGITVLNKALFYLDLLALRDHGATMTGAKYRALERGPVVDKYDRHLVKALEKSGIATQRTEEIADGVAAKPLSLEQAPVYKELTPREIELAKWIGGSFAPVSAAQLSQRSHDNPGWILADALAKQRGTGSEIINMRLALSQIMDDDFDVSDDEARKACEELREEDLTEW